MIKILKFSATWCGPCKTLAKNLETVLPEFKDKVVVEEVDVEEEIDMASAYGVRGVPMMVFMKQNKIIDTKVGSMGVDDLRKLIKTNVGR